MADLPIPAGYGRVSYTLYRSVVDSADIGTLPDAVPAKGIVVFTPSVIGAVRYTTATPPYSVRVEPVVCPLINGKLVSPAAGEAWVDLLGSSPVATPPDLRWTAQVILENKTFETIAFSIVAGDVVDLSAFASGTPTPLSAPTIIGPQGIQGPVGPVGPPGSQGTIIYGTTAGTSAEGNDARIVNAPALNAATNTYTGRQLFTGGASLYGNPLPAITPATRTLASDSTWRQNFQTGHGWTAGGGGTLTSDVNSTAQFIKGTQAVRVTTAGTGVQSNVRKTALPAMDLTGKAVRITFRVDDTSKLDRIALYVGSAGFANFFQWTFHTHSTTSQNYVDSTEWVTVTLHWSHVEQAAGTYSITNGNPSTKTGFTDLQFALYDINGSTGLTYHLQSMEIIPDATNVFPNGVVSVTFDDSYASVYDLARPILDLNGQRATTYNIADVIGAGNPAYMTMAQLRATQDMSGWEAAGHAYFNTSHSLTNGLRDLTEAACDEEFQRLKLWMMRNNLNSDNFAYPKGHFGSTIDGKRIDEIAGRYWATSRTIISETVENLHPAMPQKVHARTGMSTTAQVNTFLAAGGTLDKVYNHGGWYILCLHKIVSGVAADTTEINVNDLTTLLNGIAAKGIPVRPVSEVVRFYQSASTKAQVGLSNADNTSDVAKPVSTATQVALDAKAPIVRPASPMARPTNMVYWGEPLAGMNQLTAAGSVNTLHDTTDKAIGSESAKTVTPGVSTAGCGFGVFNGAILPDLTGKEIVLWVKITGMVNTPDFKFYVGNTSLNNSLHWTMRESGAYPWLRDGDWWRVTLPFGSAITTGVSPALNTLDSWQIKVYDNNTPLTLQFGGFGYVQRQTKWPNGVVSIRFDDLLKTQITTAAPYMARYGFAATSYVIAETLYNNAAGQFGGNYATLAQAHALEDLFGWEHASHADKAAVHNQSVNQGGTGAIGYTAYPVAAQLDDMRACQLYLRQQGFRATEHFAWPQGAWDATSRLSAQQLFSSAITTKVINHESVPAADPYRLRCFAPTNTVTGAQLTAEVDKAIAGKEWLTILFHNIATTAPASIDTTTAAFNTLIDYLATQNVPVRLVSEVLDQGPS